MIKNIRSYIETINLKRTTLLLIASRISEDEVKALREIFNKLDKDGNGVLTIDELKDGMLKA